MHSRLFLKRGIVLFAVLAAAAFAESPRAAVVANPDAGNANAGIVSRAIDNVAANDWVDGVPARLGPTGNAWVFMSGVWPQGISLNPVTGAVATDTHVAIGSYGIRYLVCGRHAPRECAAANDTVTVVPRIVANPDAGTTVAGTASTAIANVAANDNVNGAHARLQPAPNAAVTEVGTWPVGIGLDPISGAVTTTAALLVGTYSVQYQLCDRNTPANCNIVADSVTVAPPFAEVQASPVEVGDIEFDWGRDGVYCASCNQGHGNARFNWTDKSGNLWVGHLDPVTGDFPNSDCDDELADTSAFYFGVFGNGPEWAFSTQDGEVLSQLVYTRYIPGAPAVAANAGVALAGQGDAGWSASFLAGAMGDNGSGGTINTVNPLASLCPSDPVPLALFNDLATPQNLYWQPLTPAAGTAPVLTPVGSYVAAITGGKPGSRFVACTHQVIFMGAAPPDGSGNVYQQVFWYDIDSGVVQQLTADPSWHTEGFMFRAPEFYDNYVLITISNNLEIDVYEQSGSAANGAPVFQIANRIVSPDAAEPYIDGTEPFVNCTPTCRSYIFMKLKSTLINSGNVNAVPNGLAVTNIDPAQPMFKVLARMQDTPTIQRMDAEYYITANGPYLYYSRNTVASATTTFQKTGRWYIDMQLGIPSGGCVGSSAEGGMVPGC